MIHEWWGLNKSICETANNFSLLGKKFKVFVPDLYRSHPAKDAEDAGHKMSHLDWKGALQDIRNIKQHLAERSAAVSIMGFCMGGALTFASLCSLPGFKSGAPFYGCPDLNTFNLQNIKCPVVAHFGTEDPLKGFSDPQTAQKISSIAKEKKLPIQVVMWPGVSHAFSNQNSKYYDEKTRNQAFKMTAQLFKKS